MEYDIELEHQVAKTYEETMQENAEEVDAEEDLVPRPPLSRSWAMLTTAKRPCWMRFATAA